MTKKWGKLGIDAKVVDDAMYLERRGKGDERRKEFHDELTELVKRYPDISILASVIDETGCSSAIFGNWYGVERELTSAEKLIELVGLFASTEFPEEFSEYVKQKFAWPKNEDDDTVH